MNYLLLMYHPETYWRTQTQERDELENEAFAGFCTWMRENGIAWSALALEPPVPEHIQKSRVGDATSQLLPEITDVITGLFILDVADHGMIDELLDRCPNIGGTRLELRTISG